MSYQRLVPNNLHDGQVFKDTHVQHIEDGIVANETSIGEIDLGYTRKNTVARQFYDDETYAAGEYVWYNNVLYRFLVNHSDAPWDDEEVEQVLLTEELNDHDAELREFIAQEFSATKNFTNGQFTWYNGNLYKFTAYHPAGAWTGTDVISANVTDDFTDRRVDWAVKEDAKIGNNLISVSNFTKLTYATTEVDTETGEITVTASNAAWATAETPDNWLSDNLVIGRTYRFHARADVLSGTPVLIVGFRGVEGGVNGMAANIPLANRSNGFDSFVDFTVTEYTKRISLIITDETQASTSVKFSDMWLVDVTDGKVDAEAAGRISDPNFGINSYGCIAASKYQTGVLYTRSGNRITINGTNTQAAGSTQNRIALTSPYTRMPSNNASSAAVESQTNPNAVWKAGHRYRIRINLISGSCTQTNASYHSEIALIVKNLSTGAISHTKIDDINTTLMSNGYLEFVPTKQDYDRSVSVAIVQRPGCVFDNMVLDVWHEDLGTEYVTGSAINLVSFSQNTAEQRATVAGVEAIRKDNQITLNGTCTNEVRTYSRFRTGGQLITVTGMPSAWMNTNTYGAVLDPTHEYRFVARLISGTVTKDETADFAFYITPFRNGTATISNNRIVSQTDTTHITDHITGESGLTFWFTIDGGSVFDNAVFDLTLEDVTIARATDFAVGHSLMVDTMANGDANIVAFGDTECTAATIDGVRIERRGNVVKLNGTTGGSYYNIIFNGANGTIPYYNTTNGENTPILRNPNAKLHAGHKYRISYTILSGTYTKTANVKHKEQFRVFYTYADSTMGSFSVCDDLREVSERGRLVLSRMFGPAQDCTIGLGVTIRQDCTFEDFAVRIDVKDVTWLAETGDTNALLSASNVVDYKWESESYTMTAGGVTFERIGNRVKLNGTCTGYFYLRMHQYCDTAIGGEPTAAQNTTGFTTISGRTYRAQTKLLSGSVSNTGSDNSGCITTWRKSGTTTAFTASATIVGLFNNGVTCRWYEGTGDGATIWLYVATGMVFDNAEIVIDIFDESFDNALLINGDAEIADSRISGGYPSKWYGPRAELVYAGLRVSHFGGVAILKGTYWTNNASTMWSVSNSIQKYGGQTNNYFVNPSMILQPGRTYKVSAIILSGTVTGTGANQPEMRMYTRVGTGSVSTVNFTTTLITDTTDATYPIVYSTYRTPTEATQIGFGFWTKSYSQETSETYNDLTVAFRVEDMTETGPYSQYSGATPTITATAGVRYICTATAVTQLTFTPCNSGICSVRFTAGSNMVLNLPQTVKMPDWWSGVEAGRTYEISIEDGVYGVVTSWA